MLCHLTLVLCLHQICLQPRSCVSSGHLPLCNRNLTKPNVGVRREFRKSYPTTKLSGLRDFDSTTVTMGHGIRRLISLFESVDEIINEADRRIQAEADGHEPVVPTTDEESEEQDAYFFIECSIFMCHAKNVSNRSKRTYNSYVLLLRLVPHLKECWKTLRLTQWCSIGLSHR